MTDLPEENHSSFAHFPDRSMSHHGQGAHWFYWELGLLCTLVALWVTPAEQTEHAAFSLIALLFLWGLVRY